MTMAKNGQVGGSININELANEIANIIYGSSETNANSANSAAEKAGANMGEAVGEAFMNGFTKEFGDTIDEQTIEAISKLQGKITIVAEKIGSSLKTVNNFNESSESLDANDIIAQYLDKADEGIGNLLNQIKVDIKYRNQKIQELNDIIKTLPEEAQGRVNTYLKSYTEQEYIEDYKNSKNKAKSIVGNVLKKGIANNIKSYMATDEKQRTTRDRIDNYTYEIDELLEKSAFEKLNEEEKETLKTLYNERKNLIQVYEQTLTNTKSYIAYLSKMGVSGDAIIFNNKTLSEVEKNVDQRINSIFDINKDISEVDDESMKKIFGRKSFIDKPKTTTSAKSSATDIKSSANKKSDTTTTTETSTDTGVTVKAETTVTVAENGKNASSSDNAAPVPVKASDYIKAQNQSNENQLQGKKGAVYTQKEFNIAVNKARSEGIKIGKERADTNNSTVIKENEKNSQDKELKDLINKKIADNDINVREILKELIIRQQENTAELDTIVKSVNGDFSKLDDDAKSTLVNKLSQVRELLDMIQFISKEFYSDETNLVKFNSNELYEGSPASNKSNRKELSKTINSYAEQLKDDETYGEQIAKDFGEKLFDETKDAFNNALDIIAKTASEKVKQEEANRKSETQNAIDSSIQSIGKKSAIEQATGIPDIDIGKASQDELVKIVNQIFGNLRNINFKPNNQGKITNISDLSEQERKLLLINIQKLTDAINQINANNPSKGQGREGMVVLSSLFKSGDGKKYDGSHLESINFEGDRTNFSIDIFNQIMSTMLNNIKDATPEISRLFTAGIQEGVAQTSGDVDSKVISTVMGNVVSQDEYDKVTQKAKDAEKAKKAAENKAKEAEARAVEAEAQKAEAEEKASKVEAERDVNTGKTGSHTDEEFEEIQKEANHFKEAHSDVLKQVDNLDELRLQAEEKNAYLETENANLREDNDRLTNELAEKEQELANSCNDYIELSSQDESNRVELEEVQKELETQKALRTEAEQTADAERKRAETLEKTNQVLTDTSEKFQEIQVSSEATTTAIKEMATALGSVNETINNVAQSMQDVAVNMGSAMDKIAESIDTIKQVKADEASAKQSREEAQKTRAENTKQEFEKSKTDKKAEIETYRNSLKDIIDETNEEVINKTFDEIIADIEKSTSKKELNKTDTAFNKAKKAVENSQNLKTQKNTVRSEVEEYLKGLQNSDELTAANRQGIYEALENIITNINNSANQKDLDKAIKPLEELKKFIESDKDLRVQKDVIGKDYEAYIKNLIKSGRVTDDSEISELNKVIEAELPKAKNVNELNAVVSKIEQLKNIITSEDNFNSTFENIFNGFNNDLEVTENKINSLPEKFRTKLSQAFNDLGNELENISNQADIDKFIANRNTFNQSLDDALSQNAYHEEAANRNSDNFNNIKNKLTFLQTNTDKCSARMADDFNKVQEAFDNIFDEKSEQKFLDKLNSFEVKYSDKLGLSFASDFVGKANTQNNTLDKFEKKIQTELNKLNSGAYDKNDSEVQERIKSLTNALTTISNARDEINQFISGTQNKTNENISEEEFNNIKGRYQKLEELIEQVTVAYDSAIKSSQTFRQSISNDTVTSKLSRNYEKLAADMEDFAQKNSKFLNNQYLAQRYNTLLEGVKNTDSRSAKGLTDLQHKFAALKNEIISTGEVGYSLKDNISFLFEKIGAKAIIGSSIGYLQSALRQVVTNVRDIDSAMTELKKVSNESEQVYNRFLKNAGTNAVNLGTTMKELINSTADFSRLGYTVQESASLAQNAVMYANVGDLDIDTATDDLVSSLKAYHMATDEVGNIVDKFNEVGNNFALSSADIGAALKESASALYTAGNDIDQSIAMVTAITEITQDSQSAGNALKTLSMRLRGAKTELSEAGEETEGMVTSTSKLRDKILALTTVDGGKGVDIMSDNDTFKSTYEIMKGISEVWNDLSDINQANSLPVYVEIHILNIFNCR